MNKLIDIKGLERAIENIKSFINKNYITEVIYEELVELINNSKLIPGKQYRIIDYITTTAQYNTRSAGHKFDIIVTADDVNVLNENARAIQHEGDTYFANSNLSVWKLKYCLDNDTNRFVWADTTNGKGIIYYMKDEYNNECPYDFKNIQFARWKLSDPVGYRNNYEETYSNNWIQESTPFDSLRTGFYAINNSTAVFNYVNTGRGYYKYKVEYTISTESTYCYTFGNGTDYSNNGSSYDNVINEYKNGNKIQLNNIVFLGESCYFNTFDYSCYQNTFGKNCYSNTFGKECYSIIFGNGCYSNTLGLKCYSNIFGGGCYSITFGDDCRSNTFGDDCRQNTFGNSCHSNNFGERCYSNNFADSCYSNTFANSCYYNSFSQSCYSNTFDDDCYFNTFNNKCFSNTFGNSCRYNSFGNNCYSNTFGNECYYNSFGNYCSSNTFGKKCCSNSFGDECGSNYFGESCYYNTFGNECYYNIFGESITNLKSYYRYIIFDNGNRYISLNCTSTTSSSQRYQNVRIGLGVNNTTTRKTITDSNVAQTYQTVYKPANSQELTA